MVSGRVLRGAWRAGVLVLVLGAGLAASSVFGSASAADKAVAALSGQLVIAPELYGDGYGTYTSSPSGISCVVNPLAFPNGNITQTAFGNCSTTFTWTQGIFPVTVLAIPQPGSAFDPGTGHPSAQTATIQMSLTDGGAETVSGRFSIVQESFHGVEDRRRIGNHHEQSFRTELRHDLFGQFPLR
jgi:hypothetical protein